MVLSMELVDFSPNEAALSPHPCSVYEPVFILNGRAFKAKGILLGGAEVTPGQSAELSILESDS